MKKHLINGFTLLETLIANFLGLLLITLVINIFFQIKNSYQFQIAMHTIEDNINVATHFLSQDIQSAAWVSCGNFSAINALDFSMTRRAGILGSSQVKHLPSTIASRITPNTDNIIVEYLNNPLNYLASAMSDVNHILVYHQDYYKSGDKLLISNCEHAEAIQVKESYLSNGLTIIIPGVPLTFLYPKNSIVGHLSAVAYFIGESSHKNNQGTMIHSLFRKDLFSSIFEPDELVEGVNDMKIRYAVLENSNIHYLAAEKIQNWHAVVGTNISLLLDSIDPIQQNKKLYKSWNMILALRAKT